MSAARSTAAHRVLIVKLGAIGDVLMAIPAVNQLRRHLAGLVPWPQPSEPGDPEWVVAQEAAALARVEVEWVIGRTLAPLLSCYPWIRPIPVEEADLLRGRPADRVSALRRLRRALRGRYDLIATLYYDPRYRLLTRTVRARQRIALSRRDRTRQLLPGRHHTDEFARILLGLHDECRDHRVPLLAPEHLPASPLQPCCAPGRRRIALVPAGASNMLRQQTLRRWPVAHYVALAEALIARGNIVVLLGGPDDAWASPSFAHLPPGNLHDTIGWLSLPEVIAASNDCDLVVSHDTGPMHLAALSTTAIIGLFGPTDPANFLPRRNNVWGVWGGEGFACRPCYDGATFAPCPDNGCMQQITPSAVLRLIDRALAEVTTAAPGGVWPRCLVPSQLAGRSSAP